MNACAPGVSGPSSSSSSGIHAPATKWAQELTAIVGSHVASQARGISTDKKQCQGWAHSKTHHPHGPALQLLWTPRVAKGASSGNHGPGPQAGPFFPAAAMHHQPYSTSSSVLLPCLSTHHASACPGHLVPSPCLHDLQEWQKGSPQGHIPLRDTCPRSIRTCAFHWWD
jgi:hypothetical protein